MGQGKNILINGLIGGGQSGIAFGELLQMCQTFPAALFKGGGILLIQFFGILQAAFTDTGQGFAVHIRHTHFNQAAAFL